MPVENKHHLQLLSIRFRRREALLNEARALQHRALDEFRFVFTLVQDDGLTFELSDETTATKHAAIATPLVQDFQGCPIVHMLLSLGYLIGSDETLHGVDGHALRDDLWNNFVALPAKHDRKPVRIMLDEGVLSEKNSYGIMLVRFLAYYASKFVVFFFPRNMS